MGPSRPLAHSANCSGRPQDLGDHLSAVADRAAAFAAAFGSEAYARCAGLWHDLGKNAPDFQRRIGADPDAHVEGAPGGSVDHSSAGAIHANEVLGRGLGLPIAFAIAGHHAGLADKMDLDGRLSTRADRPAAAKSNAAAVIPHAPNPVPPAFLHPAAGLAGDDLRRRYELWVRMLFSCLVDADFLDTEAHFDAGKRATRGNYPSMAALKAKFDAHMANLSAVPGAVNDVRRRVLADCRDRGRHAPAGVFTLTAPTGCGKTLSGMGFALEHAVARGLDRVIVVIPYTSIIDQNAKVYRDVFGAANVIDHHASLDPKTETHRNRIACENWDAPVIVTTSVQFLESLLANKPSKCRKLHNVANGVVIFDEVQTLPVGHLLPVLDVLKELVRNYRVSLVLSTATQPALKYRTLGDGKVFAGFEDPTEIVSDVAGTFAALKRVDVSFPADRESSMTWPDLAAEVAALGEVLVIVHRRDDARDLAQLVPEGVHLSALMCPKHRLAVIDDIKVRLAANRDRRQGQTARPVRVISTQLVEAGVDLDFPVVYRALGGFDAIAQAAGRCNREGRLDRRGRVRVFVAPTDPPRGAPRHGLDVARAMLAADPGLDALDPALFDSYFRRLYFGRSLDEQGVQALRQEWKFKTVAERFQVIEDDGSEPVVVPFGDAESRLDDLRRNGPTRERLRALQPFVVTLYSNQIKLLEDAGAVEVLADTVRAIKSPAFKHLYDPRFGLDLTKPVVPDPGALMT
jgi:CRISPR-associated endonuclease/helicase Cas3